MGTLIIFLVGGGLVLGLHLAAHALARHFTARALRVNGTRVWFDVGDAAAYRASPRWARIVAATAGPIANYLVCALCFFAAFLVRGQPVVSTRIEVVPGLPAATAGLRDGDRLISVDDEAIEDFPQFRAMIDAHGPRDPVVVGVERAGKRLHVRVGLRDGKMGVRAILEQRPSQVAMAAGRGLVAPLRMMQAKLTSFVDEVLARNKTEFMGPIGIIASAASAPTDARREAFELLSLFGTYGALAWPLSILVAFLINRARTV